MRSIFALALLFGMAFAMPNLSTEEDMSTFVEENMQLFNDPKDEKAASDELKSEEASIEKVNEDFAKGKSHFEEGLYPWSDISETEMETEKMGGKESGPSRIEISRATGLIETPEHLRILTTEQQSRLDDIYSKYDKDDLPSSYDARDHGYVTEARNQMSCGSCAAFAATATHETCLLKVGTPKENLDLSEQEVLDCAYAESRPGANRCNGAYIGVYQEYMAESAKGLFAHETSYLYQNTNPNDQCQNKPKWSAGNKITAAVVDYGCNEEKLMKLVMEHSAVATGLDAGNAFGNYKSGVYDTCAPNADNPKINHAVTVIGWGTENNVDYWLIKNSWGNTWGAGGFIKVKRGTCGIGGNCAATTCGPSGQAYVKPPTPPPPPPVTPNQHCDVSALWGDSLNGAVYRLTFRYGSGEKDVNVSEVDCTKSVCTPAKPGPVNACLYICNKEKC
jgi:C1A family cysteine protease